MPFKTLPTIMVFLTLVFSSGQIIFSGDKTAETALAEAWFAVAADIDRRGAEIRDFAETVLVKNPAWTLPLLRTKLQSEASIDRQIAVRLLGKAGTAADETALLALAAGDDFFVSANALQALGDLYPRLPLAVQTARLRGNFPETAPALTADIIDKARAAVLYGLYKAGTNGRPLPPEAEKITLELAAGTNPKLAAAALAVLPFGTSPAITAAMLALCEKAETAGVPKERLPAICAVLRRHPPAVSAPQVELLARHSDPAIALEAAGVLLAMGAQGAAARLQAVAGTPRSPLRLRALALLGEKDPDIDFFLKYAADPAPAVRLQAVNALQNVRRAAPADAWRFTPLVLIITTDDDPRVRAGAALALARADRPRAIAALRDAAQSRGQKSAIYRIAAIRTLGKLQAGETLRLLADSVRDPDVGLAAAAVKALAQIAAETPELSTPQTQQPRKASPQALDGRTALYAVLSDNREQVAVPARAALYELTGADPGNTPEEREKWRVRFLR